MARKHRQYIPKNKTPEVVDMKPSVNDMKDKVEKEYQDPNITDIEADKISLYSHPTEGRLNDIALPPICDAGRYQEEEFKPIKPDFCIVEKSIENGYPTLELGNPPKALEVEFRLERDSFIYGEPSTKSRKLMVRHLSGIDKMVLKNRSSYAVACIQKDSILLGEKLEDNWYKVGNGYVYNGEIIENKNDITTKLLSMNRYTSRMDDILNKK